MGLNELQAEWLAGGKVDTLAAIYGAIKEQVKRRTHDDEISHNVATKITSRYLENSSFRISNFGAYISRCIFTESYGDRKSRRQSETDIQRDDIQADSRERADAITTKEEPKDYARALSDSEEGKTILFCIATCATFKKAILAADAAGVGRRFIRDNALSIITVWRVTHAFSTEYATGTNRGGLIRGLQREMRGARGYKKGRRRGELARLLDMDGGTSDKGGRP